MTKIVPIDTNPTFAPVHSVPDAERLISGSPEFATWEMDTARDGRIRTGVWQATPGETRSVKGETFEFCHIIQGVVQLIPADGSDALTFRAGDSFVMKPGFVGVWKTIETVRKIYVIVG
ncbi:cupin domain-containing protein [Paracoccus laeviglucosivorans]|uniref:(S)-ureidoglycine aminohydrolase cupin domain-containing protein n=1 Tax=Paracoccus laeviglucosivorans TaxID=1197861 RepID=A0A521EAN9_9RHOB|nr:cupin domain-containing protein [Paracoccus laeviglucosivorans]SMO80852.1 hypothetical protein SAMN06265221_11243 [Paracoccus laeviglucosivorans]